MAGSNTPIPRGLPRVLVGLWLFGISFGCVEAAVVAYLRAIYEPVRQKVDPDRPAGELFPLLTYDQLIALDADARAVETVAGTQPHLAIDPAAQPGSASDGLKASGLPYGHQRRLWTELGREAATLVMLASAGVLVAVNFHQWMAAFLIAFGVWDIFYYVFLKVLLDWPASLMTWDILFLIPLPWVGPVITPVLVAATMIVCGTIVLWHEFAGRRVRLGLWSWLSIVAGGFVLVVSFCWDWRNIAAGGYPATFAWPIYIFGLLLGIAGFAWGMQRRRLGARSSK